LASFCVWTKSFICKDAANKDSTVQSEVRRISKFPVSRPDDVSSRPDAHLSTTPSVRMMCHPVRTPDTLASAVRTTCFFRLDTSLYREASVPACSVQRFSSTSGRLSVLEWFTDSFQVPRKGRSINRSDNVVYRPDAYLRKARITIQNEPSEHLTVVVRTLVHRIW